MIKPVLFFVVFCLSFNNGKGAPTAVYKFVKCNPDGDQANCVTHQSQPMEWSPEMPKKLPSSDAQYLEAEPEWENESSPEEEEEEEGEEEWSVNSDAGESPNSEEGESSVMFLPEDGSGVFEEAAAEGSFVADGEFVSESGSGVYWTEKDLGLPQGPHMDVNEFDALGEAKPTEHELRADHLMHP